MSVIIHSPPYSGLVEAVQRQLNLWLVRFLAVALVLVGAVALAPATEARADAAGLGGDFVPLAAPAVLLDTRSGVGAGVGVRGPGSITSFPVLGRAGVPAAGVSALLVDLTIINPTGGTHLTIWPDGSPQPNVSMINGASGDIRSNTAVVPVGTSGLLNVRNHTNTTHIQVEVHGYHLADQTTTAGQGGFVPVPSQRLVDTRTGLGAPAGTIPAGGTRTATIGNGSPVPVNASAAFLNITIVGATRQSYLRAYPAGATSAGSTLDYMPGITSVATAVKLAADGRISFTTAGSAISLVIDVLGYYTVEPTQGGGLRTLPAARILNTVAAFNPIPPSGVIEVAVGGTNGLPTRAIAGAVLNLTTTNASAAGYLRAWPLGEAEPTNSLHNFPAGAPRASMAIVKPGTEGKIQIKNVSSGTVNLLVDLQGWYADSLPAVPVIPNTPIRVQQLPPTPGALLGPVEYAFTDNSGLLYHGHQPDPDSFDVVEWSTPAEDAVFSGPPALGELSDGRVQLVGQTTDSNYCAVAQEAVGGPDWNPVARLGGSLVAPPVSYRLATGVTVIFGVDADGRLWHYRQTGAAPVWRSLGDAGLAGGITVGPARGGVRIVGIGTDGAAKTAAYNESGSLSSWVDLGGTGFTGTPAMEVLPGYRARIVLRGADGRLVTKVQDLSGAFSDWETLGDLTVVGTPAIILDPYYGRLSVVARGTDDRVYAIWETAQASGIWGSWADTGLGTVVTDPTAAEYTSASGESWLITAMDAYGQLPIVIRDVPPSAGRSADGQPSFRAETLSKPTDD